MIETPVLEMEDGDGGVQTVTGPAVVRISGSSVLVHPGQRLRVTSDPVALLTLETIDGPRRDGDRPEDTED
jgi:N-methylhydantoinase A/oxoprolinase/acetone carboxylase beta subunit